MLEMIAGLAWWQIALLAALAWLYLSGRLTREGLSLLLKALLPPALAPAIDRLLQIPPPERTERPLLALLQILITLLASARSSGDLDTQEAVLKLMPRICDCHLAAAGDGKDESPH